MSNIDFVPISDFVEICDELRKPINARDRQKRVQGKKNSDLYPYYGATGQVGLIDDYLLDGEYVLVGEDGAPFLDSFKSKAYIINGKGWVNNHAHILKAIKDRTSNDFICYYLNYFNYDGFVNGTTRLKLTKGKLSQIPVPKFTLDHQIRIVDKVNTLFAEIDAGLGELKAGRSKLEIYKQSVLDAAIRGKLLPQDSTDEPVSILLEKIKAEKEALIKLGKLKREKCLPSINSDEIPFELPHGWLWVRLGQLSAGMTYGTSQKCDYGISGTPILRIPNVAKSKISFDDLKFTQLAANDLKELTLHQGDVLIIRSNGSVSLVGRSAVFEGYSADVGFAGYLIRYRAVINEVDPNWIHYCLESFLLRSQIEGKAKSTSGVNNINAKELSELLVPLPPAEHQARLVYKLNSSLSAILYLKNKINSQLMLAEQLKQSVLKLAFEGKLV